MSKPWIDQQEYSLTLPVKDQKFKWDLYSSTEYQDVIHLTHLHAQVLNIENHTEYDLEIKDLEDVLYTIPSLFSIKAVNFFPLNITKHYKLVLTPVLRKKNNIEIKKQKVVLNIVPTLIHPKRGPHDFIIGDKCFRNINGEITTRSDEELLFRLKNYMTPRIY